MMEESLDCLSDVQKLHKEVMRNRVLKSTRSSSLLNGQSVKDVILNKCYVPLCVGVDPRARLWETLESVIAKEFLAGSEGGKLVLWGGPGMGKTTAVEQLIWNWASGVHLQHYGFVLRLSSGMLRGPEQSLQSMLLGEHAHLSAEQLETILKTPHSILLVSDDVQDLLSSCSESGTVVCDPQESAEGAVLVHSLLRGSLLPGVSLLLTARDDVELESVRFAKLLGFSRSQRKAFFQNYFATKDKGEQILSQCEQAVGVKEICACPGFCWTLCCVGKELDKFTPETLSELYCTIMHTLLQEHKVNVETAKELIYGLGRLAEQRESSTFPHSDVVKCGLEPFLVSGILSDILRVNDDPTSPGATFSFMLPMFPDFLRAVSFYLDHEGNQLLESPLEMHDYHFLLAGLSDPSQRKLLETVVGRFSSSRLSDFHSWLVRTVEEVLPDMDKTSHWHVLRILHHTLSPTLVQESLALCKWRMIAYSGMEEVDCAALAFVVRCLGELGDLNLYRSMLTEEQAEKLGTVFRMAKSINFCQSTVSLDVMRHFARAMKDGRAADVNLSYCKTGDEATKILCSAIPHSNLHTLNLWDCRLTPACSEALAEMLSASKLCALDLGANKIDDEGLVRLVGALGTSVCTLQNLGLAHCPLTGSCLSALSSALTSSLSQLRNLDLSRTSLDDDTLEHLSQALQSGCCKLNMLKLDSCELTGSCCPSLAAALQSERCSLIDLDLSVNELDQSSALLICHALKSPNCTLEKLCMNACELTAPVFSALASVLVCGSSRLKALGIGVNKVGNAAVKHIWDALNHPRCQLQHLDLEMVNLTDAGVDELCDAVAARGSLTSLILKNNRLTDVSVPRLVKLVQDRPALELNVQYNDFSEDVFELMDVYENIRY